MEFIPKGSGCPGEKKAKRELTGSMAQTFSVLPSEEGGREGGGRHKEEPVIRKQQSEMISGVKV